MTKKIRPQAGPQEQFLSSPADIVIYGGAAGGGKTYGLLIETLRHKDVPGFGSVIFRRESTQISNEGGPWDTAQIMYAPFGAKFVESPHHTCRFPNGYKITFSHMQLERHVKQWDGSQVPLICFDELQHFTEKQFWYMLSRNRTTCGVRPYIRATCNPDPDSFLLHLLEWWIDQETGDPIEERSGVVRWFIRLKGVVYWADTKEELMIAHGPKVRPKTMTFIKSTLDDNPALTDADPDYAANIDAMLDYEQKRLKGNWFARPSAGELFKRKYFEIVDTYDTSLVDMEIRYWDRAATEPSEENNDPDWTAGVRMAKMIDGDYIVIDVTRTRMNPGDVAEYIDATVQYDGEDVVMGLEQEPGASGKFETSHYEEKYGESREVYIAPKTKNKLTCWKPVARASKAGRVRLLRGDWNRDFINELENVTDGTQDGHDDQTDGFAGCFEYLETGTFAMELI